MNQWNRSELEYQKCDWMLMASNDTMVVKWWIHVWSNIRREINLCHVNIRMILECYIVMHIRSMFFGQAMLWNYKSIDKFLRRFDVVYRMPWTWAQCAFSFSNLLNWYEIYCFVRFVLLDEESISIWSMCGHWR